MFPRVFREYANSSETVLNSGAKVYIICPGLENFLLRFADLLPMRISNVDKKPHPLISAILNCTISSESIDKTLVKGFIMS